MRACGERGGWVFDIYLDCKLLRCAACCYVLQFI